MAEIFEKPSYYFGRDGEAFSFIISVVYEDGSGYGKAIK